MSRAYRCETCDQAPFWTIEREGDATVTWACAAHLSVVCFQLQRPHERTKLSVKIHRTEST